MRTSVKIIGGVVVGVAIVAIAASAGSGSTPNTSTAPAANQMDTGGSHTVVYTVGGSASQVDVTFSNDGTGGSSQENGVSVPWTKTLTIPDDVINSYSLMPQNQGKTGTVSCEITVDGKVVARQQSSGAYALVTCSS